MYIYILYIYTLYMYVCIYIIYDKVYIINFYLHKYMYK